MVPFLRRKGGPLDLLASRSRLASHPPTMLLTQNREERLCLSIVSRLLAQEVPGVCFKGLRVPSEHIFIHLHKCDHAQPCSSPSGRASPAGKEPMSCPLGDSWGPSRRQTEGTGCWGVNYTEGSPGPHPQLPWPGLQQTKTLAPAWRREGCGDLQTSLLVTRRRQRW